MVVVDNIQNVNDLSGQAASHNLKLDVLVDVNPPGLVILIITFLDLPKFRLVHIYLWMSIILQLKERIFTTVL